MAELKRHVPSCSLFGVLEAAPSSRRWWGAGNAGLAGGGVCTRPFLAPMGAEIEGLRAFATPKGRPPSSESLSVAGPDLGRHNMLFVCLEWIKMWFDDYYSDRYYLVENIVKSFPCCMLGPCAGWIGLCLPARKPFDSLRTWADPEMSLLRHCPHPLK